MKEDQKVRAKKILRSPLPPKLELTEEFVLIIPGSTKGGPGKSSTVITGAAALKLLGLPVVVGSFDTTNHTLTKALGDVVVRLNAETPESARADLAEFKRACLAERAIGLIDLPGAMNNQASRLLENIRRARIMEKCHLILISPVRPDADEIEGAHDAINLFDPDATLLRAWNPEEQGLDWDSFEAWKLLNQLDIWPCESWTQAMKTVFTRSGNYRDLPPVPEIPRYLADYYETLKDVPRYDIEDAVDHLYHMAKYLYHTVLKDITRPVSEQTGVVAGATQTVPAEQAEKAPTPKKPKA
jgi:hypothetical protein